MSAPSSQPQQQQFGGMGVFQQPQQPQQQQWGQSQQQWGGQQQQQFGSMGGGMPQQQWGQPVQPQQAQQAQFGFGSSPALTPSATGYSVPSQPTNGSSTPARPPQQQPAKKNDAFADLVDLMG